MVKKNQIFSNTINRNDEFFFEVLFEKSNHIHYIFVLDDSYSMLHNNKWENLM